MARLIIVVVVLAAALAVAWLLQRRRPDAPTRTGYAVPDHVDRADFAKPGAPWLVAVFTSATCATCADVLAKARLLESEAVAVDEVEYGRDRDRHERYAIDAVPALLLVDHEGVVQRSFVGPVSATHLWAALADLREPGAVPPDCNA